MSNNEISIVESDTINQINTKPYSKTTKINKTYKESYMKSNNHHQNNDKLKLYCGNCGKIGHTYKKCVDAIISLGIILYNTIEINNYFEINFLLVQRRDSMGFIELLRGKYHEKDETYLSKIVDIMTIDEKHRILNDSFDDLLNKFIINKTSRQHRFECLESKDKFNRLRDSGKLKEMVDNSQTKWSEPEWGFPKGRRHLKESDYDCACREFEEETGFQQDEYIVIQNIKPLEESFLGTNKIRYKHNYFLAKSCSQKVVEINKNNKNQIVEIGNIGWFSFTDAMRKIRSYHREKINILKKAYAIIRAQKTYFKEHIIEDDNDLLE
jgi:8-oxo-dGTP pyrophosphatase MutT (NUDIX family)